MLTHLSSLELFVCFSLTDNLFGYGATGGEFREQHKGRVIAEATVGGDGKHYHTAVDVTEDPDELPFGSGVPPTIVRVPSSSCSISCCLCHVHPAAVVVSLVPVFYHCVSHLIAFVPCAVW